MGLGTVAFVGFFGFYALLAAALSLDCSNEVVAEYPSPDASTRVVVFRRDCGATTGSNTQASVLPIEAELQDEAGNLFVADTNHGQAPVAPWGGPALEVRW